MKARTSENSFDFQTCFNGVLPVPAITGATGSTAMLVGWSAGGGAEWMFVQGWSLKASGLYYDLGAFSSSAGAKGYTSPITLSIPPLDGASGLSVTTGQLPMMKVASTRLRYDGVLVRAGINYHFDLTSASIVAKF